MADVAAGLLNARRCIHGVAEGRDLSLPREFLRSYLARGCSSLLHSLLGNSAQFFNGFLE